MVVKRSGGSINAPQRMLTWSDLCDFFAEIGWRAIVQHGTRDT